MCTGIKDIGLLDGLFVKSPEFLRTLLRHRPNIDSGISVLVNSIWSVEDKGPRTKEVFPTVFQSVGELKIRDTVSCRP